ncbi:unnamed protein product [Rotaria socialis]|uniref:Uncharacterized protein n=1 Tax=Rotaria socialis TaxID=392032 RepID=A0A817UH36_9BILA|nr:unnamed protein product [Rotaria socialis]CAF4534282.1 unnamed protein product [Rotaria socialis]
MMDQTYTETNKDGHLSVPITRSLVMHNVPGRQPSLRTFVQRVSRSGGHRSLDQKTRHGTLKKSSSNRISPSLHNYSIRKTENNGYELNDESLLASQTSFSIASKMTNYQDASSGSWFRIGKDRDTIITNLRSNRNDWSNKHGKNSNRQRKGGMFLACCCHCSPLCLFLSIIAALLIGIAIAAILVAVLTKTTSTSTTITTTTATTATTTTETTATTTTTTTTPTTTTTTTTTATTTTTTTTDTTTTTTTATTDTTTTTTTTDTTTTTTTTATTSTTTTSTVTTTTTTTTSTETTTTSTETTTTTTTTSSAPPSVNCTVSTAGSTIWFISEHLICDCSSPITNITSIITLQKTTGASFGGIWTTINSYMTYSRVSSGAQIIYTYGIINGQTIPTSQCPFTLAADLSLSGTAHSTSGDIYSVSYATSTGQINTLSGSF